MRKRSGLKIEPWGTPAKTGLQDDVCSFKTTLFSIPERFCLKPDCKVLLTYPWT